MVGPQLLSDASRRVASRRVSGISPRYRPSGTMRDYGGANELGRFVGRAPDRRALRHHGQPTLSFTASLAGRVRPRARRSPDDDARPSEGATFGRRRGAIVG